MFCTNKIDNDLQADSQTRCVCQCKMFGKFENYQHSRDVINTEAA